MMMSNVNIEIDVTPDWWSMLGGKSLSQKYPIESNRIAKAMMMAVDLFPGGVAEVRVTRYALKLLLRVPMDVGMDTLVASRIGVRG